MQKIKGSCLCGKVTFAVARTFDKMFMCNCDQCRQITGTAFAANLFTGIAGFNWLSGEDNIATYQMPGRDISKSFCRVCGSGVPRTSGDGTNLIVPAGTLKGEPEVAAKVRIFVSEQPSWSSDLDDVEEYLGFPP